MWIVLIIGVYIMGGASDKLSFLFLHYFLFVDSMKSLYNVQHQTSFHFPREIEFTGILVFQKIFQTSLCSEFSHQWSLVFSVNNASMKSKKFDDMVMLKIIWLESFRDETTICFVDSSEFRSTHAFWANQDDK